MMDLFIQRLANGIVSGAPVFGDSMDVRLSGFEAGTEAMLSAVHSTTITLAWP